ncbi:DEAD/DEAH box helicase [Candidatus Phytoplasma melaleucae]|uniref:DEAD/DEAH box helicase n=1 Tax=Candidatus Phytoplasma melaleucae TaxID=2982630 RepID=A0ABT9DEG1_9MOLU|nr:DEAD/DEAH box helicase ['Melaleuca sp.' phytoplasma]MDO8168169.1 DEAD/DEAH box helicase ['Melaleuca sp.' phytoplasma]
MSISFSELKLLPQIENALLDLNFSNPTDVQSLVIPEMIKGYDIVVQSQTGTGKTFAFAIPTIAKIDPRVKEVQSLILCPTRELALQVFNEINKLLKFYSEIKTAVIYGGESYTQQFQALEAKPHIIIATPGRIIDLLQRKRVNLSTVKILIFDEADEMLKMGFQEAVETILEKIPKNRQTALFSATMPASIKQITLKYQNNPKILKTLQKNIAVTSIEQFYFIVKELDKNKLLVRLLDYENPDSVIIFANTKRTVDNILSHLQSKGFLVDAIHGDLKQKQRQYVMNNFRKKHTRILVATDVAARGLDITDIKMVINYDLSYDEEVYVHRIGRTGRAGKSGVSYSFVNVKQMMQLKKLESYLKEKLIFVSVPTIEEIYNRQNQFFQNKVINLIEAKIQENPKENVLADSLLQKYEAKKIISGLLQYLMPEKRQYEDIMTPRTFSNVSYHSNYKGSSVSKIKKSFDDYNKFRKPDMTKLVINLGKEDGINPSIFLKIMSEKFNIYSKNIGNIKHLGDKTIFEISNRFLLQVKTKNNIYLGEKLLKVSSHQ